MSAYRYTQCGLDNVWLENGYLIKKTRHGEAVAVNDVEGLHRLLAITLAGGHMPLSGKEFRFLRTLLGLTQEGLAKMMGVTEGAVSLWERKGNVPRANDQLIRLMVLAKHDGEAKVSEVLERIRTVEKLVNQKYVVRDTGQRREVVVRPIRKSPGAKTQLTALAA